MGYIFPVNIEIQPSSTVMKTMMKHEETIQKSCLVDIIWVNYNDLTATSLESWLVRGIIPKWPYFRLVKYYNLPRYYWGYALEYTGIPVLLKG
jgi:hypothetical protein